MREMEADVLQRSGCFPKAALLPVNKQKYWSAKYNISLRRLSGSGDAPDSREQRKGMLRPCEMHPDLQGRTPEREGGMDHPGIRSALVFD